MQAGADGSEGREAREVELLHRCSNLRRRLQQRSHIPEELERINELQPHVQALELRVARAQSSAAKQLAVLRSEVKPPAACPLAQACRPGPLPCLKYGLVRPEEPLRAFAKGGQGPKEPKGAQGTQRAYLGPKFRDEFWERAQSLGSAP